MLRPSSIAAVILLCVTGNPAVAANVAGSCTTYMGTTVSPQSFDDVVARNSAVEPKGEFETSTAYAERIAASGAAFSGPLIVSKEPEDRKYFEYDADNQRLGVKSYVFDNTGFDAWSALYSAGYYGKIDASVSGNLDVVISQVERNVGSYQGNNAYGATATISKIERTTKVVFQGQGKTPLAGLFPSAERAPYEVGSLSLTPADAQQLKPQLKIAFVVTPKEPFVIRGSHSPGKTTIRNPVDITEEFVMLLADFHCGLLLDGSNRVLGAYPTR